MAFDIQHNGRTYGWLEGEWVDTARQMVAPAAIRNALNAEFIRRAEHPDFLSHFAEPELRAALFVLLREEMGVSLEKLSCMGFFEEVLAANPELALASLYASGTAPSSRTLVNCKRLRDRFFAGKQVKPFDLPAKLLGDGPFEQADLKLFLKRLGVPLWKRNTPVHALVLGREGWDKKVVDEIVEAAEGSVLQIYSQEMIVSVLAGQPDPFHAWPLTERLWDLYAFRQGHPGLEYVSNGWAGWIKGVGSSTRLTWSEGGSDFNQVEQSPLSVMGYRVGLSGIHEEVRRQLLRSAFQEPLPFVESSGYMEAWGKPSSAERLKRIAQHLVSAVESHRNIPNHGAAVNDWRADLAWLKEEFYRGVYTFSWPQV